MANNLTKRIIPCLDVKNGKTVKWCVVPATECIGPLSDDESIQ